MSAHEQFVEHQIDQLYELVHESLADRWKGNEDIDPMKELIEAGHARLETRLHKLIAAHKYKEAKDTAKHAWRGLAEAGTLHEALNVLDDVMRWSDTGQFA